TLEGSRVTRVVFPLVHLSEVDNMRNGFLVGLVRLPSAKRGEVYGDRQGEGNIDQLPAPEEVRRINVVLGLSKAAGAKFLGRRLHEFRERVGSKRCHRGTRFCSFWNIAPRREKLAGGSFLQCRPGGPTGKPIRKRARDLHPLHSAQR